MSIVLVGIAGLVSAGALLVGQWVHIDIWLIAGLAVLALLPLAVDRPARPVPQSIEEPLRRSIRR